MNSRTAKRDRLRDSSFAYIDKDGERHLPINDESHVRNAISRFDQTDFESTTAKHAAARKILAAAKRHDIEVSDDQRRRQGRRGRSLARSIDLAGSRRSGHRQCQPPSTMRSTPLTAVFSSRKTAAPTISSIVARRPRGVSDVYFAIAAAFSDQYGLSPTTPGMDRVGAHGLELLDERPGQPDDAAVDGRDRRRARDTAAPWPCRRTAAPTRRRSVGHGARGRPPCSRRA